MSLELVAFIVLSAGALASASVVVIARNPIHSAISLVVSFFFLAGLYLSLNANFVAIIQVLVYAGAIMVLFMFVIMLLNLSDDELGDSRWNFHKVLGSVATLVGTGVLIWAIVGASTSYLNEPAYMRNHSVERLRRMGNVHAFRTLAEREAWFEELTRMRQLAVNKLRLERGSAEVRADACRQVARFELEIDAERCDLGPMQDAARGYASANIANYDARLIELEAAVDPSPVPAAWRGKRAERIPATEVSRDERAVLALVDITYALRLERLIDTSASRYLTPEQLTALDAAAARTSGLPSTAEPSREQRALSTLSPGGRMKTALARLAAVEEILEDTDEDSAVPDATGAVTREAQAILDEYEVVVIDVLTAYERREYGPLVQALSLLDRQVSSQMTEREREQVRTVLADLSRGGPRWLGLWLRPAIYDEDDFGSVKAVGTELLTHWLLPFEVTAVLLLVGILGATVIAKRRV